MTQTLKQRTDERAKCAQALEQALHELVVEDFETNRCSSCQEAVELMQIADIRATIKEMRVVGA